jgi:hypothetical protein
MKRFPNSSLLLLTVWIMTLGVGYACAACGNCLCIQYDFELNASSNARFGFSGSKTDPTQTVYNAYGGSAPNWGVTCLESGFGETNNTIYVYTYGTLTYPCDMPAGVNPPYVQEASGGTTPAYLNSTLQGNCGGS